MAGVGVTGAATTTRASSTRVPLGQPLLPVNATLRTINCCPEARGVGEVQGTFTSTPEDGCGPDITSAIVGR